MRKESVGEERGIRSEKSPLASIKTCHNDQMGVKGCGVGQSIFAIVTNDERKKVMTHDHDENFGDCNQSSCHCFVLIWVKWSENSAREPNRERRPSSITITDPRMTNEGGSQLWPACVGVWVDGVQTCVWWWDMGTRPSSTMVCSEFDHLYWYPSSNFEGGRCLSEEFGGNNVPVQILNWDNWDNVPVGTSKKEKPNAESFWSSVHSQGCRCSCRFGAVREWEIYYGEILGEKGMLSERV